MTRNILKKMMSFGICVFFVCSCCSGCSPAVRKKFVRQKKKEEDLSFVPVLDPVEYPNQIETVKTRYDYFYALLKVWQKDAATLIDDEYTDKQMVYTIRQMRVQLDELEKILTGTSRQKIRDGQKRVDEILAFFDQPKGFRNRSIIRKRIQKIRKVVINPLAFEYVKNDLGK